MGPPLFSCGPRAAGGRALRAACYNPTSGACSSDGQSGSLLSCGSGVRIPSGAPASDGGCSSVWLERQVVALEAAGSNPVIHPTQNKGFTTEQGAPITAARPAGLALG